MGDEGSLARFNPIRPFVHAYNAFIINWNISPKLDSRFRLYKGDKNAPNAGSEKCLIDLALATYQKEKDKEGTNESVSSIDTDFKRVAMGQIKLFLFSGHDTTSSSACYISYALSQDLGALTRIRAEHDEVFGKDPSKAVELLCKEPYLLSKVLFTVAIIKETLRLYPAASTTRAGEPDRYINDDGGRQFPTDGCLIWLISHAIQRDPRYWPDANKFLPERWLVAPDDPLYPVKGAWRPFEYGPRACIGIELAMLELKTIMILALRSFDVHIAYDEDFNYEDFNDKRIKLVEGERGYQLGRGQLANGLPCRVNKRGPR